SVRTDDAAWGADHDNGCATTRTTTNGAVATVDPKDGHDSHPLPTATSAKGWEPHRRRRRQRRRTKPEGVKSWSRPARLQPDAPQPTDLRHPALGHPVGRDSRRYALGRGELEERARRVVDLHRAHLRPLEVEALDFVGDLDDAARVHDVV